MEPAAGSARSAMKVNRQSQLEIPTGICLRCFNAQQQFAFPFLVYCSHNETLAVMRTPGMHMTFPCAESQLPGVLQKLRSADQTLRGAPERIDGARG
jgi:hypothetical protein